MKRFLRSLLDEAHEQAALALFIVAICLELFTSFEDMATVSILLLSMVTLFGSKRYNGFNFPNLGGLEKFLPSAPQDEEDSNDEDRH